MSAPRRFRALLVNAALVVVSLTVFLGLGEVLSRWLYPVPVVASFDAGGNRVTSLAQGRHRLTPDLRYRIRAKEYDAWTTHNAFGFRGPMAPDDPEILLLGDSVTYGQGLEDEQTFAYLFCNERGYRCMNIARPASGTLQQVEILERALQREAWRPRLVMLFMQVTTRALDPATSFQGNDLGDNLRYARLPRRGADKSGKRAAVAAEQAHEQVSLLNRVLRFRRVLRNHSNLYRAVYSMAAPTLRAHFTPPADPALLREALAVTGGALRRLDGLAAEYGFDYRVHLLFPQAELTSGHHVRTENRIAALVPGGEVHSSASALLEGGSPGRYFYPFDGHPNAAGARRLADWLIDLDSSKAR